MKTLIGVISDTHGLLRPEAVAALRGSAYILHAGDIGGPDILEALAAIAPVTAVRGNNDTDAWARHIPDTNVLHAGGVSLYVLHDAKSIAIDPAREGHRVVVAGHSHRPLVQQRDDVLFVNPGSAGPRRFSLPITVARIVVHDGDVHAEIVLLNVAQHARARAKT